MEENPSALHSLPNLNYHGGYLRSRKEGSSKCGMGNSECGMNRLRDLNFYSAFGIPHSAILYGPFFLELLQLLLPHFQVLPQNEFIVFPHQRRGAFDGAGGL